MITYSMLEGKKLPVTIGIIGGGKLGNKTWETFAKTTRTKVYDAVPERSSPPGTTFSDMLDCWAVVVCISAPIDQNGQINTDMIIDLVGRLKAGGVSRIIVRNRMPHGMSDSLEVYYLPNIKGSESDIWILGKPKSIIWNEKGTEEDKAVAQWIKTVIPGIKVTSNVTCEITAMSIGSYLSAKMCFFNELHNYCASIGTDYQKVRELVCLDDRVGESHTLAIELDEGRCSPRDLCCLEHQIRRSNMPTTVMGACVRRRLEIDV